MDRVLIRNIQPICRASTPTKQVETWIEITRNGDLGMWSWHEFRCLGIEFEGSSSTGCGAALLLLHFCGFLIHHLLFFTFQLCHLFFSYKSLCFFPFYFFFPYFSLYFFLFQRLLKFSNCILRFNPQFAPKKRALAFI